MRIKRIEIIGFKSFCDKTVVNIEEPITAIVGPNGCGKSNIIDATRWCMGEQSAKHLRGKSMEDVIFAGSDTRGPAGMAEVSLTFENVGFSRAHDRSIVRQDESTGTDDDAERLLADLDGAQQAADIAAFDPTQPIETLPAQVDRDALVADDLEEAVAEVVAEAAVAEAAEVVAQAEAAPVEAVAEAAAAPPELEAVVEAAPKIIDYSQYGEVTITRRLFRDGTSEYFINKTPSRLRDITEFFLGTGVGTKAYSIIEQGRVGMIVSAKPEDRRLIIEEAAGITKFKKKKQAAERKMEQTRQNLLRVSDVTDEIDKRLGSLRRQAQKAERYKKYRAELRDIELWSASHRYLGIIVETGVVIDALAARSTERAHLAAEFEKREAAIVAERAESQLEEKAIQELTQTVFDLDNRVKLGESQVEFQGREARDLEDRVLQAGGEIDTLRVERELAERELDTVTADAKRLESEAGERTEELARLEEEHRLVRGQLQDAQSELDGARAEIGKAQADIARAEGNVRALERRRSDLDMRLARVSDEEARAAERHAPLVEQVAELEKKLDGLRQLRLDLADQKQDLEKRQVELKEQHGKTEAEVETLRTELHRRRSRLQSLVEIQDRYEGFARGTRAVMQHRPGDEGDKKRILGLVADMVTAPAEYEPAVEALLGDRLGSILVESKDVGALAVDFLKQRSEGRSTFIPVMGFAGETHGAGGIEVVDAAGVRGSIASLVHVKDEYASVADYLLGDALVVESLARALELLDAGVRRTMVTLDGDVIDPRGVVTGGSRETAGAGVLQQKREIRELEEISEALDRDLADAQARHVSCKAELQKVSLALDGLRKHAHEGDIAFMSAEKDHARYKSEAERLAERRGQLGRELAEMQAQLADCEREEDETRASLDGARRRAEEAERRQLGLIEGVTMARGDVDDIATRVTDAKIVVAQAGAAQKAAAAQRGRLELHEAELARRVEKLEKMIGESGARATQLREESTRMSVELVSLRADRLAAADELSARKNEHEQRMADLQVAEVELREVRSAADKAASDCHKLETKRDTLAQNRLHLEEAILEKHRVELVKELHEHHLRPPITQTEEARLKELRDLIDRMGEINLTAIEEYEELAGRHDFLSSQRKDLENALDQLETAIAKINKTSRKLFRETFEAVNAKFQEVFPRLFRGGNATLRLTGAGDDDELLDAGVEIFAQPPGKKNSTVEQLSGGEKALTAVAMIFSIFLIKPSPFCILDEVDAPLDEANVGRYNELVRSMTEWSQFIVITHNKRTMEIADSLYGVTMEEPGCSKLVNVNLKGFQPKVKRAA